MSKELQQSIDDSVINLDTVKTTINSMPKNLQLDADDVYQILTSTKTNITEKNIKRSIQIVNYIRLRFYQKIKPAKAFSIVFPERCIPDGGDGGRWKNKTGKLSSQTIAVKWKRLESSQLFKKIYAEMSMSPYIIFAVDRMKVLGKALQIAMDDDTPTRDRFQYMKLFLEETKEPEPIKEENNGVNININYGKEIESVNDNLKNIAQMLKGKSAQEIIDTVLIPSKEGGSNDN